MMHHFSAGTDFSKLVGALGQGNMYKTIFGQNFNITGSIIICSLGSRPSPLHVVIMCGMETSEIGEGLAANVM